MGILDDTHVEKIATLYPPAAPAKMVNCPNHR